MLVKLVNGNLFTPQGSTTVEPYGVMIEGWKGRTVIPLSQIKWIYIGEDEKEVLESLKSKRTKSIYEVDKMSSADLLKEMGR